MRRTQPTTRKAKISSTSHVQMLQLLHGKQQQQPLKLRGGVWRGAGVRGGSGGGPVKLPSWSPVHVLLSLQHGVDQRAERGKEVVLCRATIIVYVQEVLTQLIYSNLLIKWIKTSLTCSN